MIGFIITVALISFVSGLLAVVNAKNPSNTGKLRNCNSSSKCAGCTNDTCSIKGGC